MIVASKENIEALVRAMADVFEEISQEPRSGAGYFSRPILDLDEYTIDGSYDLDDVARRIIERLNSQSATENGPAA